MSLAKLAPTEALHRIFVVRQGLDVLLNVLTDKVCAKRNRRADLCGLNCVMLLSWKGDIYVYFFSAFLRAFLA